MSENLALLVAGIFLFSVSFIHYSCTRDFLSNKYEIEDADMRVDENNVYFL